MIGVTSVVTRGRKRCEIWDHICVVEIVKESDCGESCYERFGVVMVFLSWIKLYVGVGIIL